MSAVRITLETLRILAAQASTWLLCALLCGIWPFWILAGPLRINSDSASDQLVFYHLAIGCFAVGAVRGVGVVARLVESVRQIATIPGLPPHMLAVGSVGLAHVLFAFSLPILMGALDGVLEGSAFGVELAAVFLTIVSFSCLLLHLHVEAASTPWLVGVAILLAPMVLPDPLPTRSLFLLSAALLFASWLLDHPPGRTT